MTFDYYDIAAGKAICKCDIVTGKIIDTYNSIKSAERINGKRIGVTKDFISTINDECFLYYDDINGKTEEELREYIHSMTSYLLYCLDTDGNIVKIYKNVSQAAKLLNTSQGNIISSCNGVRMLACGYQWCYQKYLESRINKKVRDINNFSKRIVQYGMNGVRLKEWRSITEASEQCGIILSDICSACSKSKFSAGGYQWRYAEEAPDRLTPWNFSRKVRCLETDELFSHANDAAKKTGISIFMIKKSCLGFRIHGDYRFVYDDMTPEECQRYEENKDNSYLQPSLYDKLDEKLIENVCNEYNPAKGMVELVEKYDVTFHTIRLILNTNGIECCSKNCFDYRNFKHDYFDIIDNPIKAYWLGFLFGKSSFDRKYLITISASGKYIGNIKKLVKELELDRDLTKAHGNYSLQITSIPMSKTLKKYGIGDRTTVNFPILGNELLYRDFLRGFFESSGGATSSNRHGKVDNLSCAIYANLNICIKFLDILQDKIGIQSKVTANNNSFSVRISSVANIDKFLCYLYYDNCYCYCLEEIQEDMNEYATAKHIKMHINDVVI